MTAAPSWRLGPRLRPWQQEALERWQAGGYRGVVSVVTGAGKTIFAEACIVRVWHDLDIRYVVVVVPTLALVDQWFVSLVDDLTMPPEQIAVYSGESAPASPRAVNLMVLNTARRRAPEVAEQGPSFLVVDECHRAASPENARALAGPYRATLGMSATPARDYDDLFEEVVTPALGPIVYRYDYNRARSDEVIAPFELVNVRFLLTEPEEEMYSSYTRRLQRVFRQGQRGEDVADRIARLLRERAAVSTRAHMRVPLAVRLVENHPGQKVVVFHEEIRSADEIVALLRQRGRRAAAYHSRLGPDLRRDNLRQFRRGQVDVLVTCRSLDEGVNVPDAGVAVVAASTASTRQRIQRLGRVLRPSPGKDRALVYTLFATDSEERRLRDEATSLDGAESVNWLSAEYAHG